MLCYAACFPSLRRKKIGGGNRNRTSIRCLREKGTCMMRGRPASIILPLVIGSDETSNEGGGEVQRSKTVGRDSTSSLLLLLFLFVVSSSSKVKIDRESVQPSFVGPSPGPPAAAAAPWQSHRSHSPKPNLSSFSLACRRTCVGGPAEGGGGGSGALSHPLPPLPPSSSVGRSVSPVEKHGRCPTW